MPPKKAAANTSAKVTKAPPAMPKSSKTSLLSQIDAFERSHIITGTARKGSTSKVTAPATRAAPKRVAYQPKKEVAEPKATIKKAAPKRAAPKKAITATSSTTTAAKMGTKRKAEEEAEAPPAKKAAVGRKIAPAKKPTAKKTALAKKPAAKKTAPTTKGTKRKVEDEVEAPPAKMAAIAKKIAPAKKPVAKKDATATQTKAAATKKTTSTRKTQTEVPAKKSTAEKPAAATSRKRKATDESAAAPAKKAKVLKKGAVINEPPTERLNVYVFGEGSAGELGLGTSKRAIDVMRPRLNVNLAADKVGVVQVVAGGMHVIALTHDNKILTDTEWDGGLKDVDAAGDDSDEEDDDNGLNPKESTPGEVDFSAVEIAEGARFVQVAAGDSCSFALTDDGRVYGWGTFRGNEGIFGFNPDTEVAKRPVLNTDLKKITSITAGANHALALDSNGAVFAWGSGQQNQLGRRVVERTKLGGLRAREFGLPKGAKKGIVSIVAGSYHNFAIDRTGNVYSWGLNNYGQTGVTENAGEDEALVLKPQVIEALKGKHITSIEGGGHHSLCSTSDGDCLIWGRVDGHQMGIEPNEIAQMGDNAMMKDDKGAPRIIRLPQKVTAIEGAVVHVAASSDHNVVITKEGKAWSWGFSANYQTGQAETEDVEVATMIDNTATRDVRLNGATAGGQFSIVTAGVAG
ncbi:hypothetical protein LTR82_009614 [Friedmanniomyces endolithicus]|uniref:RCC1-like domain-containing protein n=1 Tax=Friedmanniomyces endolithicus TaxID=329885 RepID=A0AAN6FLY3_9PEZI|nr:hypothetical protein LTR82_009614 [Friedmanniomyces endolithicus]